MKARNFLEELTSRICCNTGEVKHQSSLLTSVQISRLDEPRSQITIESAKEFPLIRFIGKSMPNLVLQDGVFTANINRHGDPMNMVILLSTIASVSQFKTLHIRSSFEYY
jgi:hypothetical protein